MSKPVILAIDDDASVLETVVQDLRRKYGENYRILRASSGQAALDAAEELARRGDSIALFLSDQRMPGMTGIELLEKTIAIFPDARRALLTAYADTEAAIRAINAARIHYYLTKPWDPPEEKLYPVVDDLLESWCSTYRAPFEGLRVIGARYGLRDHQVRDFLTKNYVPYVWMDPDSSAEGRDLLARHKLEDAKMPVLLFPDGSYLVQPGQAELAERIGLRTQSKSDFYDLVILGAGLAGLAAAVYGASEGAHTGDRAGGAGRTGGQQLQHRELSRISRRLERSGAGAPRVPASVPFWGGVSDAAGGGCPHRKWLPLHPAGRPGERVRAGLSGSDGRALAQAAGTRTGAAGRVRSVLRRGPGRGQELCRRGGLPDWGARTPPARRPCTSLATPSG